MAVKSENYVTIQGWMVGELGLKGNDLLIYALIYGFSQDGNTKFTGSLQYMAEWCNSSKSGIQKNLRNLIEKGLIEKKEVFVSGVKFCEYYATKLYGGMQQSVMGYATKLYGGMQQSGTNNIDNNNSNTYKNNNINPLTPLDKALIDFEEMRKKIRKPLTENAKHLILQKLEKMAETDEEKIEILNQSIMNSWQGIFPLKKENDSKKKDGGLDQMSRIWQDAKETGGDIF